MPDKSLTVRTITSGMLLGAVLTPCNIYSGLKIGWSFDISIIALLLASAFWAMLARLRVTSHLGADEANITQTPAPNAQLQITG